VSLLISYQGCVFLCAVINTTLHKGRTIVAKEKSTNNNSQPLNGLYIGRKDWFEHAACKGLTHLMFPKEHKDITYIAEARRICSNCPVKEPCLEYALEFPAADMHGVWAGLTSRQLAAEQRRRGVKPTRPTLAQMWGD
jgi:WhiB family redox-sensing transcriptional regulator